MLIIIRFLNTNMTQYSNQKICNAPKIPAKQLIIKQQSLLRTLFLCFVIIKELEKIDYTTLISRHISMKS